MTLFGNLHTDLSVAYGLAIAHLTLSLIWLFNLKLPQFIESLKEVPVLGKGLDLLSGNVLDYFPILGKKGGIFDTVEGITSWMFKPENYLYISTVACVGMVVILNQAIQDEKVKN